MNVKRAASFIGLSLSFIELGMPPALPPATAQAASRPGSGPRTVRLSESDLNVTLASSQSVHSALADHGIGAVQIELQEPNVLIVHAAMRVHGFWQNVQISGTLVPDSKTGIRFDAFRAQDGRFPLPLSFVTAQTDPLAARFSLPALSRLLLSVQSVRVEKKDLVIIGLPVRPASPRSASPARR